jgi:hypothetical protein
MILSKEMKTGSLLRITLVPLVSPYPVLGLGVGRFGPSCAQMDLL